MTENKTELLPYTENLEIADIVTAVMREADQKNGSASTRNYVREWLLPLLHEKGLSITRAPLPADKAAALEKSFVALCLALKCLPDYTRYDIDHVLKKIAALKKPDDCELVKALEAVKDDIERGEHVCNSCDEDLDMESSFVYTTVCTALAKHKEKAQS